MIGGEEHRAGAGVEGSGADVHHILEVPLVLGAPPGAGNGDPPGACPSQGAPQPQEKLGALGGPTPQAAQREGRVRARPAGSAFQPGWDISQNCREISGIGERLSDINHCHGLNTSFWREHLELEGSLHTTNANRRG